MQPGERISRGVTNRLALGGAILSTPWVTSRRICGGQSPRRLIGLLVSVAVADLLLLGIWPVVRRSGACSPSYPALYLQLQLGDPPPAIRTDRSASHPVSETAPTR